MRIIGGQFRSIPLTSVGKGDEAAHLRPTPDRVRESLFNMIEGGRLDLNLEGARVLDLFAGSGALGLEALSRGASRACFVENGRTGFKLLSKNIAKLKAAEQTSVLKADATRLAKNPYDPFDVVFLDPPYGQGLGGRALSAAREQGWLADGAHVFWEEAAPQIAPEGFALVEHKTYGSTHFTVLTA